MRRVFWRKAFFYGVPRGIPGMPDTENAHIFDITLPQIAPCGIRWGKTFEADMKRAFILCLCALTLTFVRVVAQMAGKRDPLPVAPVNTLLAPTGPRWQSPEPLAAGNMVLRGTIIHRFGKDVYLVKDVGAYRDPASGENAQMLAPLQRPPVVEIWSAVENGWHCVKADEDTVVLLKSPLMTADSRPKPE